MTLADQIVSQLQQAGVRRIYGIVGDSLNPVVDAVRRSGGSAEGGLDWINVRHEEAAALAASAEAQMTGELAVCAGSCGPGNLHLLNGLYDAQRSGAPVLAIASHIPSGQIGMGYFQETHPDRLFTGASVYSELITDPEQSPRVVHSAITHALAAPGVAVVTLPGDVASLDAEGETPVYRRPEPAVLTPSPGAVGQAARMIDDAERVVLFAGLGARHAREELNALADHLAAPVAHSLRGKEWVQPNPYDVGMTGLLGYGAAAEAIEDADLLVLVGTDFPYDEFLPDGPAVIQVDVRAEVLGRRTGVDLPVHGDAAAFLRALTEQTARVTDRDFLDRMLGRHAKALDRDVHAYTRDAEDLVPIHPELVADRLDALADPAAVITADTGMCNVWQARYIDPAPGDGGARRRLLGSFVHGTMANALPHAIGAQLADRDRQVVAMAGDGGLSMLLGELLTAVQHELPVKVVLFDNSSLGMVKLEMLVESMPDHATDLPATDYAGIARAAGWHAVRVDEPTGLDTGLREVLGHPGPALLHVITDPNALSLPPDVTGEQVVGFAGAMGKVVATKGIGAAVAMARSNWRNIPRP